MVETEAARVGQVRFDCREFHPCAKKNAQGWAAPSLLSPCVFGHFPLAPGHHLLTAVSYESYLISEPTTNGLPSANASRLPRLGLSHVWVRFLFALVGLILAFAAALFSTVSREAGSVWGTVVMASVALLLATFVGLTTVPYLARRVVASQVREAMDYDVTRAGMIYILISVVIGIAAINTGNNLLYVIVASRSRRCWFPELPRRWCFAV